MHESFLKDIAIALSVAAFVSILARRFKLPTVLSYLAAGLIIGPYIPIPLFADHHRLEMLSELGVILVMFNIGLEFRISRFIQVLPTAGASAFFEMSVMGLVGMTLGYLFGWPTDKAIFLGGALAISSTMIVSKVFEEHKPAKDIKEHVLSMLVVQDLVAILLITVLGTFAATKQLELGTLAPTISKLLFVLIFSTILGLFFIPKVIRYVAKQGNLEVLTIVAIGICFGSSLFVESMGYSVALGAFLSGILVAESGESHKIEKTIRPLKDVFAAIFFVSIGMSVNPIVAYNVLHYSVVITLAVVFFQFASVFLGGVLSGVGANKSLFSGLALGQIGEFAFIITSIGVSGGIVGADFQAIVVSVAVLSSLCTPLLWQRADRIVCKVQELTPIRLRIAIGLYEAWFDRLRNKPDSQDSPHFFGLPKAIVIPLVIDIILLLIIPPAILKFLPDFINTFGASLPEFIKNMSIPTVLTFLVAPVLYGFVKTTSQLVRFLTDEIFSDKEVVSNEQEALKKLFSIMIWSIVIFLAGTPLMMVIRPFTNSTLVLATMTLMLVITLTRLWRRASEVANDFKSGGQRLVTVLKRQTFEERKAAKPKRKLQIPGLENIEAVEVKNSNIIGKPITELASRNLPDIKVVSIHRGSEQIMFPNQEEVLVKGDILQIWGSDDSKRRCALLLSTESV